MKQGKPKKQRKGIFRPTTRAVSPGKSGTAGASPKKTGGADDEAVDIAGLDLNLPAQRPATDIYAPSTDRHGHGRDHGHDIEGERPKTGMLRGDVIDDDEPQGVRKEITDTYAPGEVSGEPQARPKTSRYAGDEPRFRTDVIQHYTVEEDEEEQELDERSAAAGIFASPAWDIDESTMEPDIDRPATNWFFNAEDEGGSTQEAPANLIKDIRREFEIGGPKAGWQHYLSLGGTYNPWTLPEDLLISFIRLHYGRKDWDSLSPILDQMIRGYPADADQARLLKALELLQHQRDPAAAKTFLERAGRESFKTPAHQQQFDRLLAQASAMLPGAG